MSRRRDCPPPVPELAPAAGETVGPQITETDCQRCGTRLSGLDGRYACPMCGWTNPWSDGHTTLPTAEDDPDYPGPDQSEAPARKRTGARHGRATGPVRDIPRPS